MARPPRLQAPGTLHHLIARGNERREVFRDDADREDYLARISRYRERFGFRLYAYCLMPNHIHLALEQGPAPISAFMHALQSSYTQRFNRRYDRVGHLFQGRYKSFLVECDRYFAALVRYIHENPVKAGLVETAHDFRWSSDRFFRMGTGPTWLDLDRALAYLASTSVAATPKYRELMSGPGAEASAYASLVAYEGSVKGAEGFAVDALSRLSFPRRRSRAWTSETVASAVAACDGFTLDELRGTTRQRDVSRSRLVAAYLGRERFGIPVAEAARLFRRDESTFAHGVRRLEKRIDLEPAFKDWLEAIVRKAKLHA